MFERAARQLRFRKEFLALRRQAAARGARFALRWRDRWPCLEDRTADTPFDRHYVYHTAWAARVLAERRPTKHVDISSSLYFCAIASAFVPVDCYDFRPPRLELDGLRCDRADLLALPFDSGSIPSLSCMHVLEHVGLARYGDPLDYNADLRAFAELERVLAPGGDLLVVVPVGKPRIQFNAHRIYAPSQIRDAFAALELRELSLIPDDPEVGGLIRNAPWALAAEQRYACGCFWFTRAARSAPTDPADPP